MVALPLPDVKEQGVVFHDNAASPDCQSKGDELADREFLPFAASIVLCPEHHVEIDGVRLHREGGTADRGRGLPEQTDQHLLLLDCGRVVPGLFTDELAEVADGVLEVEERLVLVLGLITAAPYLEFMAVGVVDLPLALQDLGDVV